MGMRLCYALITFLSEKFYWGGLFVVEFDCINFTFGFVEIGEIVFVFGFGRGWGIVSL